MRDFGKIRRIVVKVGTNLLSSESGVDRERIRSIVSQIAALRKNGLEVMLVSSGAVGLGAKAIGHLTPVRHIPLKQACASIGQPMLMRVYEEEFASFGLLCSQVLITRSSLNNRKSYNNLRDSVGTLLDLGVVPIFNENDVVSTAEIGDVFGDNDRMSAYCASKMDAELLLLLTDIDGVYTGNPKKDKDAVMLKEIKELTPEVFSYAKGAGSTFSTGGMKTKLLAAEIAQKGGCGTIIASGYEENAILRILKGEDIGTYILPTERLKQRERWILNTPSLGSITIDDGAVKAILSDHKSLLPKGIIGTEGFFLKGDVIEVKDTKGQVLAKAITNFSDAELSLIKGKDSKDIPDVVGKGHKVVFRPEDMVEYEQL